VAVFPVCPLKQLRVSASISILNVVPLFCSSDYVCSNCGMSLNCREFDLRAPEMCKTDRPQNVLINLNEHVGPHAEAKCLSINPVRPELLAVGANDPYVRLYDRRMLHCRGITFPADTPARLVLLFPSRKI